MCDDEADFSEQAQRFVEEGVRRGRVVLVAVTAEHRATLARSLSQPRLVRVADIGELGRNPSRIIPAIIEFVEEAGFTQEVSGGPCQVLVEPLWPGQSRAEIEEVARHEALVDTALCRHPVAVLSLALARFGTDPLARSGTEAAEGDVEGILSADRWPLEQAPTRGERLRFDDLGVVREHVQGYGEWAGMEPQRVDDLVLAVNELASNSLRYGGGGGSLHLWTDDGAIVCEVEDVGVITDPLAGRRPPGPDLEAPGLWLVNQLCDLVQIRSGPEGTRIRIRVRCGASSAP